VVVVGSGIAGLSTAYELCKLGQSVIVIDRGKLAGGMTSRTSAHLTSNIDDLYQELIRAERVRNIPLPPRAPESPSSDSAPQRRES